MPHSHFFTIDTFKILWKNNRSCVCHERISMILKDLRIVRLISRSIAPRRHGRNFSVAALPIPIQHPYTSIHRQMCIDSSPDPVL